MKKKYCILTIMLIILCIILPIAIEQLYILGETHPLIFTTYTASDILGYIATVIGLIISIVAIFLSLQTNIAAPVGVGARNDATKSQILKSPS